MSLLKQLLLSVSAAILAIVIGTLAFSVGSARSYLDAQVRSESENAAVSLAITLSQPFNQDPVIRELLLMALFDTGRFQEVRFDNVAGKAQFERRREAAGDSAAVPGWFRRLLPLEQAVATREVSDGWKQVGRLTVIGDNSYAYASLWRSTLRQLLLVLAAGALWALVIVMLMRWLRRALNEQVAQQVRAIADGRELPVSFNTPVRELDFLLSEVSQAQQRVRATSQEMGAKIESLNLELNQDAVTALPNRRFFVNELRRALQDDQAPTGHVMMMRIRDLAAVSEAHSRHEVDVWLREAAQEMRALARRAHPEAQAARLNGSDFAILMPGQGGPQATRFAQSVCRHLRDLSLSMPDGRLSRWAFSLTDYVPGQEAGSILGMLDHGLMRAESAGHVDVEYVPRDEGMGQRVSASEGEWRTLLRQALDENGFELHVEQQNFEGDGMPTRGEASLQVRDGDNWLPGSLFMPVAVRLNLSTECDLRAIDLAMAWIRDHRRDLVIRVSLATLAQSRFWPAVRQRFDALVQEPQVARQLSIELDAHGLAALPDQVRQFCQEAKEVGVRIGLRRLDSEPGALTRLHRVQVDYLRLGAPLIESVAEGMGGLELLRAIQATARRLHITLVADAPTDERNRSVLREHDVGVATD